MCNPCFLKRSMYDTHFFDNTSHLLDIFYTNHNHLHLCALAVFIFPFVGFKNDKCFRIKVISDTAESLGVAIEIKIRPPFNKSGTAYPMKGNIYNVKQKRMT